MRDYTTARMLIRIVKSLSFKNEVKISLKRVYLRTIGRDKILAYVGPKFGPPKPPPKYYFPFPVNPLDFTNIHSSLKV
jgi:hypothetical protein